jgi:hypothetical protein
MITSAGLTLASVCASGHDRVSREVTKITKITMGVGGFAPMSRWLGDVEDSAAGY